MRLDSQDWQIVEVIGGLSIFCIATVFVAVNTVYRRSKLKKFASENGFELLGKELVDGLYLRSTSFAWRDVRISNSMQGVLRGSGLAIFDISYEIPDGTNARFQPRTKTVGQTVAAFRRDRALQCDDAPSTGQDTFHIEIAGDWLVCFTDDRRVALNELMSWCNKMYDQAAQLIIERKRGRRPSN